MAHQQALDQVTAQANANMQLPPPSSGQPAQTETHRSQQPLNVDKPADDGYNWWKYGQKQVKGSEFPRSYYKYKDVLLESDVAKALVEYANQVIIEVLVVGSSSKGGFLRKVFKKENVSPLRLQLPQTSVKPYPHLPSPSTTTNTRAERQSFESQHHRPLDDQTDSFSYSQSRSCGSK